MRNKSEFTDAEIVGHIRRGKRQAFGQLVQRYQNMIYGLAYHHTQNFEDARDVAQETFIHAYRQLPSLRQPDKFGSWLKQMTINQCRMHRRERAAHREEALTETHEKTLFTDDASREVGDRLAVQQAMATLSQANRLTLTLFYFYSYSLEELSDFLEVPVSTVMSRLRNARRQLKKEWQQMTQDVIAANRLPEDWAEKIPIPYDEYDPAGVPTELATPLSAFREGLILAAFPPGSIIASAQFEGGSETGGLFTPVRATVQQKTGGTTEVRLRMQSKIRGVEVEAKLLPALHRLGLPVAELLAGPETDPDFPEYGSTSVTRILPGKDVLSVCWERTPEQQEFWIEQIFIAIERLHSLTAGVEAEPVASMLDRNSLASELADVVKRGGPWMEEAFFAQAVRRLKPLIAAVETPLVFSNGVYAPNAFHTTDGETITGYNNFTFACFEDPHIGFAKYRIYDWFPLNHAGIVEKWCARHNITRRDFALRIAVRCLTTLQRELPVRGQESADYRNAIETYLKEALNELD